jgi:hypothetical protein
MRERLEARDPLEDRCENLLRSARREALGTIGGSGAAPGWSTDSGWAGMNGSRPVSRGIPHFQQKAPLVSTAAPQFPHTGTVGRSGAAGSSRIPQWVQNGQPG